MIAINGHKSASGHAAACPCGYYATVDRTGNVADNNNNNVADVPGRCGLTAACQAVEPASVRASEWTAAERRELATSPRWRRPRPELEWPCWCDEDAAGDKWRSICTHHETETETTSCHNKVTPKFKPVWIQYNWTEIYIIYHFNHTNYYLFHVNHTSFNKICCLCFWDINV